MDQSEGGEPAADEQPPPPAPVTFLVARSSQDRESFFEAPPYRLTVGPAEIVVDFHGRTLGPLRVRRDEPVAIVLVGRRAEVYARVWIRADDAGARMVLLPGADRRRIAHVLRDFGWPYETMWG